jgi:hypothetical protein
MTPQYVPPISIVLASGKNRYVKGLSNFRQDDLTGWLTTFASAATQSANLANVYLGEVEMLQKEWRAMLAASTNPRSDAAAWKIIDALPAHPMITVAVAVAVVGRTKAAVSEAMAQLELAGVLIRESQSQRNRTWEARGLLNLLNDLESGVTPTISEG